MLDNAILFFVSFFFIWIGSGLIVSSADRISKKLKLSSFALSFFILGILTSIPEFALGITAINQNDPDIFVGNLLGGIVVLFLFVIPVLAIFGNGIKITNEFDNRRILLSLFVISLPSIAMLDLKVSTIEAVLLICAYVVTLIFIQTKKGILTDSAADALTNKSYSFVDLAKVAGGLALVFLFSHIAVDKTLYFSDALDVSPFIIGLIILSVGTNLPELSLALRSVIQGKKDVALGDYIGSAAVNTLLLGVLTLMKRGNVVTVNHFIPVFVFTVLALAFFYVFSRSDRAISRLEGVILVTFYILFILFEVVRY